MESSLKDHISQLQRCVQSGSRVSLRHLDSCAFWKQAYERSEAAHSDLLDKQHELEQQIEQLRNDLRQSKAADLQAGVKRKRSVDTGEKQSTKCKRTSTGAKVTGMQQADEWLADTSIDLETGEESGGTSAGFAGSLFALRRLLSTRRPDASALAMILRRTCTAANETLSASIESFSLPSANTRKAKEAGQAASNTLIKVTQGLRFSYPSLLQALGNLSVKADTEGCAVYAVVLLFQKILGHLHAVAARKECTTGKHDKSTKLNKQRIIKQHTSPIPHFGEICMALTKLAIHFFEALDLSQLSHNRALEGLVCVFLDHLGSSLSLVVFANVDDTASQAGKTGVLPPRGLLDISDLDLKDAIRTTQHEACYLVIILRHLMLCIDKKQSLMKSGSVPFLTLKKSPNTNNNGFAARIRDKLQNTLLRGVFGDDDESFKNALRGSAVNAVDDEVDIARTGREEPGEWFVGEVWRLLGWTTLTGENGVYVQNSGDLL